MQKILIADDEEDLRNLLKEGLSMMGYEVICCKNGEEAVASLSVLGGNNISLALIDLTMPDISGFEVAKKIKQDAMPIKILIMTCHLSDSDKEKGRKECGVDNYISKPFSFEEILKKVSALIGGD